MTLSLWLDQQIFGHNIAPHSVTRLCSPSLCRIALEAPQALGVRQPLPYLHWLICLHPFTESLRFVAARNDLMSMAALLGFTHL